MKRLLLILLIVAPANAATILIAPDDVVIGESRAVVVATAESAHTRWAPAGWIETVTTMRVEESIKGPLRAGASFELVELGGIVGHTGMHVPGSPRFEIGERAILFLDKNGNGEWSAKDLAAGVFRFRGDHVVRTDLCAPREPLRLAEPFLRFVRETARGIRSNIDYVSVATKAFQTTDATPSITSYLAIATGEGGTLGSRWRSFSSAVVFLSHGTQPGALGGGLTSLQRGLAVWTNDGASSVVYSYGGTTARDSAFGGTDGINSILFDDPSNEINGAYPGSRTLAVTQWWFDTRSSTTHVFNGERFYTILEADMVVQNGLSGPGVTGNGLDHVIAHELGHSLGFRHSDTPESAGGTTSSTALMNSTVDFDRDPTGAALQAWDRDAVAAVYGSGTTCTPPSITTQPQPVAVATPQSVTLSVAASSATQPSFQWFLGQRGVTSSPIAGSNASAITVSPQVTTSYWVRVSNGCAPNADSDTATVTVAGCPAVIIRSTSADATIIEGKSATLSVDATGGTLSYLWFAGDSGVTTTPIGGNAPQIEVKPTSASKYWVRVTNHCGATSDSAAIAITVLPCVAARVVVEPVGGDAVLGDAIAIYAGVVGTQPLAMQWYEGAAPDQTRPVTNGSVTSITTNPILVPTSFWLRVENDCGSDESVTARVNVVASCVAPQITQQPASTSVTPGATALLTAGVSGTSLTYRWYQGPVFDFTKPVGGNNPSLLTAAITSPTEFWLHVTNACGTASSAAVSLTPVRGRRRIAR